MERIRNLKLVVFDVDGVFTDGRTWQDTKGEWRRGFSVRDAIGIRALKKSGVSVAVITSASAAEIREHMAFLGIEKFFEDVADKASTLAALLDREGLRADQVALVSEDPHDLELMRSLGAAMTVVTADTRLQSVSHYVTTSAGGDGAVLEICNFVLQNLKGHRAADASRASAF